MGILSWTESVRPVIPPVGGRVWESLTVVDMKGLTNYTDWLGTVWLGTVFNSFVDKHLKVSRRFLGQFGRV